MLENELSKIPCFVSFGNGLLVGVDTHDEYEDEPWSKAFTINRYYSSDTRQWSSHRKILWDRSDQFCEFGKNALIVYRYPLDDNYHGDDGFLEIYDTPHSDPTQTVHFEPLIRGIRIMGIVTKDETMNGLREIIG